MPIIVIITKTLEDLMKEVEGWETMTAPLNERAANSRICIETQAKHFGTTEKMPVAVGFKTNSDYRAAFYVGK